MTLPRTRHSGRELLDGDRLDPAELRMNLREMAMLNRLPGGVVASVEAILRTIEGAEAGVVIDVGTGAGDLPAALLRRAPGVRVIASDRRPDVLAVARRRLRDRNGSVGLLLADARALPLPDAAVDVAHASLLVHHLDPPEVVVALGELRRVSRRGVVINDLRRGAFALAATTVIVMGLARGRYTRHDGVLSARRAYTIAELDDLAARAGLRPWWRSASWLPRVVTAYR